MYRTPDLLTLGDIAPRLGVDCDDLCDLAAEHGINPVGSFDGYRVFTEAQANQLAILVRQQTHVREVVA